jgi:hypothetical protein
MMRAKQKIDEISGLDGAVVPQFDPADASMGALPWEEIAAGRYMPRRIRGSCRGRALG